MKRPSNMHPIDRSVRLIVGLICVYIGFVDITLVSSRPLAVTIGLFGAINLWAFATTRCPVYSLAHFSTSEGPTYPANDES